MLPEIVRWELALLLHQGDAGWDLVPVSLAQRTVDQVGLD